VPTCSFEVLAFRASNEDTLHSVVGTATGREIK